MTSKTSDVNAAQKAGPVYWTGLFVTYMVIPVILLGCGGRLDWWQGWVFSVIIVGAGFSIRLLAEKNIRA